MKRRACVGSPRLWHRRKRGRGTFCCDSPVERELGFFTMRPIGSYGEKIGTLACSFLGTLARVFRKGWSPRSRVIASSRMLDLDHLGTNTCSGISRVSQELGIDCHTTKVWAFHAYPRSPRICVQYGWVYVSTPLYVNILYSQLGKRFSHTPANTLVMSSTLTPVKGPSVSVEAVEAKHRWGDRLGPRQRSRFWPHTNHGKDLVESIDMLQRCLFRWQRHAGEARMHAGHRRSVIH